MKKLSEYHGEEAIELLGEILEPVSTIMADKQISEMVGKDSKLKVVQYLLKYHSKQVIEILATLDGKTVDEFDCNLFTLPMMVLNVLNDEVLVNFFSSQLAEIGKSASGSAMENTEETEAMLKAS